MIMLNVKVHYWVELKGIVVESPYEPYVEIRIGIELLNHTHMFDEEISLDEWVELKERGYVDLENKQGKVYY